MWGNSSREKEGRQNKIFKINLFKLIEKRSKPLKSLVTLTFLKNYLKDIKQICKENSGEFE